MCAWSSAPGWPNYLILKDLQHCYLTEVELSTTGYEKGNSDLQRKQQSAQKTPPSSRGPRAPYLSNMVSQTEQPEPSTIGTEQFTALMQAIIGCQTRLTAKIEQMQMEMGLIRRDMDKYSDRLKEAGRGHRGHDPRTWQLPPYPSSQDESNGIPSGGSGKQESEE